MNPSESSPLRAVIRLDRPLQTGNGVAVGLALIVALNVFLLVGGLGRGVGVNMPAAYLISLLLFLPIALTYLQYLTSLRRRHDLFGLFFVGGNGLLAYLGAWLMLLGYAALLAGMAWGAGGLGAALLSRYVGVSIPAQAGAVLFVGILGIYHLSAGSGGGEARGSQWIVQSRPVFVLIGVVGLVLVGLWAAGNGSGSGSGAGSGGAGEAVGGGLWSVVALLALNYWGIGLIFGPGHPGRRPAWELLAIVLTPLAGAALLGLLSLAALPAPLLTWSGAGPGQMAAATDPRGYLTVILYLLGPAVLFLAGESILSSGAGHLQRLLTRGGLPRLSEIPGLGWLDRTDRPKPDSKSGSHPNMTTDRSASPGNASVGALLMVGILSAVLAGTASPGGILGLAALCFLWATALLNLIQILGPRQEVRRRGSLVLPFYPLAPGVVVLICVLLPLALPLAGLLAGLAGLLTGAVLYWTYARPRWHSTARDNSVFRAADGASSVGGESVLDPATDPPAKSQGVVVAVITDPAAAVELVRSAARLAQARHAQLMVLSVLTLAPQLPAALKQFKAREQLDVVNEWIGRARLDPILTVLPYVRSAPSLVVGVLDTVMEERADLLVLGWREPARANALDAIWDQVLTEPASTGSGPDGTGDGAEAGQTSLPAHLEEILRTAPCDVALVRGRLPRQIRRVTVALSQGDAQPHGSLLDLGRALAPEQAVQIVAGASANQDRAQSRAQDRAQNGDQNEGPTGEQILAAAQGADLLLLDTARSGILALDLLDRVALQVVQAHSGAILILRPFSGRFRLGLRRLWAGVSAIFPALSDQDRAEVSASMRVSARPSIDFFMLITLAATIATLGLLQNSAAVIIGAMLVAPLMSPIVSMAMAVVEGDGRLLGTAGEATTKGLAVAIAIGVAMTLLTPEPAATSEIMGRTQPTLLDLAVALASGAAGGYALCRKEVSSSLPGVSIAVALVPPLCVVGYGIASAQFDVAGGAFLLFSTNVIAIVLAAAVIFLLLGFRPLPQQESVFQRGIVVSLLSLVLIAIPLGILLNISMDRAETNRALARTEERVVLFLEETLTLSGVQVGEVLLSPGPGEESYDVRATLYAPPAFNSEDLAGIQAGLAAEIGQPIRLRTTLLTAQWGEWGE